MAGGALGCRGHADDGAPPRSAARLADRRSRAVCLQAVLIRSAISVNIDSPINMSERHFLTAAEAAAALGVRRATLYAYVSRGLLRSEDDPSGRGHRYAVAQVEALKQRAAGRRDPTGLVRGALDWGVPVLDSSLTLIAGGRLRYRGLDAVDLARRGETLERVAALLWLGSLDVALPGAAPRPAPAWPRHPLALLTAGEIATGRSWRPMQRLLAWLPLAAADDPAAYDLRPASVVAAGARLLPLLATCATGAGRPPSQGDGTAVPVAAILAQGWAKPGSAGGGSGSAGGDGIAEMARLIDAALVLSADHELNVSAFTARCVASARAPLAAVVQAGLAALSGARHGAYADRVEALFDEIAPAPGEPVRADAVRARLADRLRRGEEVPGFGHPLYPDGDPRGRLLVDLAAARRPGTPAVEQALAMADAARDLLGDHPTLDFGLVTLARALGLPAGAAVALFAIGRAAGWIAHALEQYADPRLIRPRARYVGPDPPG
jgi:citrate synthase